MEPSIPNGARIGCTSRPPERIERGDVVVFDGSGTGFLPEGAPPRKYVKRVVGLPGETVAGSDGGVVTVDGKPVEEPYADLTDSPRFGPARVPEGEYFLLGVNRDASSDSRFDGTVPHANVLGTCDRILTPRDRRGRIAGT